MIISQLKGGLGNQLFQYAAGYVVAKKWHTDLKLDILYLYNRSKRSDSFTYRNYALKYFNISASIASNKEILSFTVPMTMNRKLYHFLCNLMLWKKTYTEKKYTIDEIPSHAYMIGYWQKAAVFNNNLDGLLREFSIKKDFLSKPSDIEKLILSVENPVCIHFRRGDYVNLSSVGFLTLDYYKNAIEIIQQKLTNFTFFVFSDDIYWCKNNFRIPTIPTYYVDCNSTNDLPTDYLQFYLMMNCHHFIIPNSTFSYWGALLGDKKQKIVIAPKKWHVNQKEEISNIIPANWISI